MICSEKLKSDLLWSGYWTGSAEEIKGESEGTIRVMKCSKNRLQ
jgi:hypothetical protein